MSDVSVDDLPPTDQRLMLTFARIAALTSLSVAVFPTVRADQPAAVGLQPRWKQGEKFKYEMTRRKTWETDGKVVRGTSGRAPVDVEVIAAGETGYVVRWKLGETVPDDPKLADHPLVKVMTRLTDGMTVDLEVDAGGELLGIRNWKELQETGRKIQETVLGELERGNVPKATVDVMRAETGKLFASKQAVEASFTRHPALLVAPLGQTYNPGKVASADVALPNPFGGDPIPAKAEFTLKKHDPAAGLATVTYTQKPDPKELGKVLDKTARGLAKKLGKALDDATPPAFDLTDEAEYAVETKTGWVRSVTHTRRTRSGASVATETTTLVRREQK
ncbi:hypothetical protein J0H58_01130 [bacterium]|nr:hypothetical protein [bacterium]